MIGKRKGLHSLYTIITAYPKHGRVLLDMYADLAGEVGDISGDDMLHNLKKFRTAVLFAAMTTLLDELEIIAKKEEQDRQDIIKRDNPCDN